MYFVCMTQHLIQTFVHHIHQCDVGIVVSIAAFQAVDPGSIPGHRKSYYLSFLQLYNSRCNFDAAQKLLVNNFRIHRRTYIMLKGFVTQG